MPTPLYQCMTKATTAEGDQLRRSANWVTSRRATLKLYEDALECGDWRIPYDAIDEAVLFSTRQMFIPTYVLRIASGGTTYQFGLNPGRFWKSDLPFPVTRERARLGYSKFSVAVRVALLAYLAYAAWGWLTP